jgi:murein L,D-transpeptidase YafK
MSGLPGIVNIFITVIVAVFVLLQNGTSPPTENMDLPKLTNPRLVVKKAARKLEVYDGRKLVKTYKMVLGFTPKGDKETEGDGKTPEGKFYVFTKNAESRFHLSLGVSYPGIEDAKRGLEQKLVSQEEYDEIVAAINEKRMPLQKTKLGGEIYIHGGGVDSDWTDGCVALTNEEITELFEAIPVGTEIEIRP